MTYEEKVTVHFALNEIDAQTAAGALRANKLHPLVWRDPYDVGASIGLRAPGRFVVLVPRSEERAARAILRPRRRRKRP